MFGYILRRVLATIPVVVIVAVFVFLLLRLTPGDAAAIIAGDSATPAQIENIRKSLGLTEPLTVQFRTWMTQLASGDLGTSIISRQPVTKLIGQRVGPTLQIATLTIILSVLIAVPLGVLAAWRHRSWLDYAVMAFSVIGFSIPAFVVGYILMKIFAVDLRWLPVQGFTSVFQDPQQFLCTAVLPCMTLATVFVALIARMTRASMLDVLGEDYIRTARAKASRSASCCFATRWATRRCPSSPSSARGSRC